jgi:hypothetical protein
MNALTTFLVAGIFAVSTAACAGEKKEEPKKEVAAEVKKDAAAAPQTKRVCVDIQGRDGKPVIDAKTKKPKQNCITVKVREKFEGTKMEDAKKK